MLKNRKEKLLLAIQNTIDYEYRDPNQKEFPFCTTGFRFGKKGGFFTEITPQEKITKKNR